MDGAQKGQLMEQVKAQIAVANAQELLQVRLEGLTAVQVCQFDLDTYFIAHVCFFFCIMQPWHQRQLQLVCRNFMSVHASEQIDLFGMCFICNHLPEMMREIPNYRQCHGMN